MTTASTNSYGLGLEGLGDISALVDMAKHTNNKPCPARVFFPTLVCKAKDPG